MCVCHHKPNLVSVYVMEAILKVLTVGLPGDVCVFVYARSRVVWVCVCACFCHFPSPVDSHLCVCMHMYVNITERLRLHKAVTLLVIMKYFVLKTVSYSNTTTPYNLINKQSANSSTERKSQTVHTR